MNLFQPILIATACVLALSACASAPPAPRASAPSSASLASQPATASGTIQPAAAEVSAYGGANTGGTYPYGTIQTTDQGYAVNVTQQANAEITEGVVVMGPGGEVWLRDGGENAAYQGAVESCYAYARGQVAHDVRIESDVASAFDSDAGGFGLTALRGRMNNFERTNRVPALFSSCMTVKGYDRQ